MYLGGKLSNSSGQSAAQPQEILTNLTLGPGKQFPDIELIDGLYNPATSKSILDENGTVILFMDHQCPPCKDVAQFWQKMIEDGAVNKTQVVGICFANAANIYEIHNKYQIDFPIYADERYTFLDHYGVDAFPLVLIVDELGMITYIESDSNVKIDRDELKKRLQG
ncbi:MAG: peroxiredoxin family protein, partial [Candidatus Zixiibacteriota bacterium]